MSFNETGTPPPDVPDTTQGIVAPVPARTRAQNVRYGIALFVGGMFWLSTFAGTLGLLVPARLAVIAPSEKAAVLGVMVALGAVIALVANVLFGALSDMTRTRWGARTPWLLVGSVTTAGTLVGLSTAQTTGAILVWWCLNQFFLNAIVAPMIATIPDRSPRRLRGTYSAVYGVGFAIGGALSQIVGSMFITAPSTGILVFAGVAALSGILFALISPDRSNVGVPRTGSGWRGALSAFAFPRRGSRDFYLAFTGKFLMVAAGMAVTNYQLYLFTDYVGIPTTEAASLIASLAVFGLVIWLVFGGLSGPLSDKLRRRKIFVVGSAVVIAFGTVLPAFTPLLPVMIASVIITVTGQSVFNSVDQALNTEVLPNPKTAAKDLGVLNVAITAGQAAGPVITSVIVTATGSYQLMFPVVCGVSLISAFIFTRIRSVR